MTDTSLIVSLGERSYPIFIGAGLLNAVAGEIEKLLAQKRPVFAITSPALAKLYPNFNDKIKKSGGGVYVASCDGEGAKRAGELEKIWEALAGARIDRTGVIIAFGGGVIGDLAGFAAASYQRGIDFIQVPTTLLAAVDSSVGGKTGINLAAGKNLAGAFHQPIAVYADTDLLATLPAREFAAGMAEVIKYGMLGDRALFDKLAALGDLHAKHPELPAIIRRCCEIKARVVAGDERELAKDGGRALLNLGHTFGHAIENVAGYGAYLHGEAVAVGLALATRLSIALGMLNESDAGAVENLLLQNNLPVKLRAPLPVNALLDAMRRDKKVRLGALRFVVMNAIGDAATHTLDDDVLLKDLWCAAGAAR